MVVLQQILSFPAQGVELTPDGFGDRGARLAANGGGTLTFRRGGPLRQAQAIDHAFGSGVSARRLALFELLMRERSASLADMTDWWATAYAALLQFSVPGAAPVTAHGWTAARDHMRRWALAQPYWMRSSDAERQEACDRMALVVGQLMEEAAADRVALQQGPPADPIKRVLWVWPTSRAGAITERAQQAIRDCFVASERPEIERLLRMP